jgi:hypothetical protein
MVEAAAWQGRAVFLNRRDQYIFWIRQVNQFSVRIPSLSRALAR